MKFKIGFWNVNGLGKEKYQNDDFFDIVKQYDILCMTETWRKDGSTNPPAPKGYKGKYHNRKIKHAKAKRSSGGILILYKTELHDHIKVVNNKDENIWIKINKTFPGLQTDLLLGTVYMSPKDSKINKHASATDTLEVLYDQIASFPEQEHIIVGGDFNARIGNLSGRVTEDTNLPGFGNTDTGAVLLTDKVNDISIRERVSEDKKINTQGSDFAEFCTSTDLCILNGRTIEDLGGKYTYVGQNGCSTVDFALSSENATKTSFLRSFKVEELNIFSDHRPITVSLEKKTSLGKRWSKISK